MDYLIRGMARNDKVRIISCDCKETVDLICKKHQTFPLASVALGRFLCATVMLGAMLKDKQTITCVLNPNGKLGTIFAQANAKGDIRGFVSNSDVNLPLLDGMWDIKGAIGEQGILTIIKNFDEEKNFSSQVTLKNSDIADTFATYFFESEQMPTIIFLSVELDKDGNIGCAKGYIVQLMTGYDEDDIEYLKKMNLSKLEGKIEDGILEMFYDFKKLENSSIRFVCDCNKDKFEKGLESLKKEELTNILKEDGQIEVVCNFCSEKYLFNKKEIEKIIKDN